MKVVSFAFILFFVLAVTAVSAQNWSGSDDQAEMTIKQISPDYKPWFSPVWEPPSGEIESFLFSVQSAIGAFIVGYVVGKNKGRKDASDS